MGVAAPRRRPAWALPVATVALAAGTVAVIRVVRSLLWDGGRVPEGPFETIVSYGSLLWALPAVSCVLALLGMALYRDRQPTSESRGDQAVPEVCFRIVSRCQNVKALRRTVDTARRNMVRHPLFPYRIEVVTDRPVPLPPGDDVRGLVVPHFYETPSGARFKARTLQYALDTSDLEERSWIFHLDEESRLTPSVIAGIRDAVVEEEASGRHRIGQGLILYHRHLDSHPFLTLADMVRTGDDIGRFHLDYREFGISEGSSGPNPRMGSR